MGKITYAIALALLVIFSSALAQTSKVSLIQLKEIGGHRTGIFDQSAVEITAYGPVSKILFVVNAARMTIETIDIGNPRKPMPITLNTTNLGRLVNSVDIRSCISSIDADFEMGEPHSVAMRRQGEVLGVAVEAMDKTRPGMAVFIRVQRHKEGISMTCLNALRVGALPDMITFTPDGQYALVANEGQADIDGSNPDPEGSISLINLPENPDAIRRLSNTDVVAVDFTRFNAQKKALIDQGIRIIGNGPGYPIPTVAMDLEPEYIAVAEDSKTAWVTLQENNALAKVDIANATVTDLLPLGVKKHWMKGNGMDASSEDGGVNIRLWPVHGMFQPDAISAYSIHGQTFLVTANEGDARTFEKMLIENANLDTAAFPEAVDLQRRENLGQLKITSENGANEKGEFEKLFSFGARSFSIWDAHGTLVFDSGDDFERITEKKLPKGAFNTEKDKNRRFDSTSSSKGPEPEGVAVGKVDGRWYAFIGLEEVGGIMVYDITNPSDATFVQYINLRDFTGVPEKDTAGDMGPEGILFIEKEQAPSFKDDDGNDVKEPLLVVANEVSGSITIFRIMGQSGFTLQRPRPIGL